MHANVEFFDQQSVHCGLITEICEIAEKVFN